MIQLAKTGWLEERVDVFETIPVCIEAVMIRLYHGSSKIYEFVGNGSNLKLDGAIAGWRAFLFSITAFFAIVRVLFGGTTGRIAVSAAAHLCILHGDYQISQEIPGV
jgi:hypothetical protein